MTLLQLINSRNPSLNNIEAKIHQMKYQAKTTIRHHHSTNIPENKDKPSVKSSDRKLYP